MTGVQTKPAVSASKFGAAVLDADLETPGGIVGPDGKAAPKRFNVYRNNVIVSLCEALGDTFPAIKALVGDEYFSALARVFVTNSPPQSPVLIRYGAGFPDFLDTFPPLADYPYLGDVARVEWAWLEAFHAADEGVLDPAELGAVPEDQLGEVRFQVHPATRIVASKWPVHDLVRSCRFAPDAEITPDMDNGQSVLITRPDVEVGVYLLRPAGDAFLLALLDGQSLGDAAAAAYGTCDGFSLSDSLTDALSSGAFSQISFTR